MIYLPYSVNLKMGALEIRVSVFAAIPILVNKNLKP